MNDSWPPLDTHAHVETVIDPAALLALRAVVLCATRSLSEFEATDSRSDPIAVWGVGVHPGVSEAFATFTTERFERLIRLSPLVSEVGLDRSGPVPMARQRAVLHRILAALRHRPRVVSMHSAGAADDVLDALKEHATPGVILHWWRGSAGQTEQAIELGCRFSINQSEVRSPLVLGRVPSDRILTETDYPQGSGRQGRPGNVAAVEQALAGVSGASPMAVRHQVWGNLAALIDETRTETLFPDRIRRMLAAARRGTAPRKPRAAQLIKSRIDC